MGVVSIIDEGRRVGITGWIREVLRKAAGPKEPGGPGLAYGPEWLQYRFPEFRALEHATEGYAKNAAVFLCVEKLMLAYPQAPLVLYRADSNRTGADKLVTDHPLQVILNRPNAAMSQSDLRLMTMYYMAIGGNAYWHKIRAADGRVVALWPYGSDSITPQPGVSEWIGGYLHTNGSGRITEVAAADIVHFRWPSVYPEEPWRSLAPLDAIAREYQTDNEMTRYAWALLKNDATPKTVIIDQEGKLQTEEQRAAIKSKFDESFGGDNRGKVGVLKGGLDIKRVSLDLAELAFDALRRVPETRIASAFLLDPIYAGLTAGLSASTYDNRQGARTFFFEDTITQFWRREANIVSASLIPEFTDRNVYAWHDTRDVIALRQNEDSLHQRATASYTAGILTRNEARHIIGLDPTDDGDQFAEPSDTPAPPVAEPSDTPAPPKRGSIAVWHKSMDLSDDAYFKAYDGPARSLEEDLQKAIAKVWRSVGKEVLASITPVKRVPVLNGVQSKREPTGDIPESITITMFDDVAVAQSLFEATETILATYITETFERAVSDVGRDWAELESRFDSAVRSTLSASTGTITEVAPRVKQEIMDLLSQNYDKSAAEISSLLGRKFKGYAGYRARRIARTTATYSTGASQKEAWRTLDVAHVWLDERRLGSNHRHAHMRGQRPEKDGMFYNSVTGARGPHPGAMNSAADSANCMCVMRPRPKTDTGG